jgi:hypothetical protein
MCEGIAADGRLPGVCDGIKKGWAWDDPAAAVVGGP